MVVVVVNVVVVVLIVVAVHKGLVVVDALTKFGIEAELGKIGG